MYTKHPPEVDGDVTIKGLSGESRQNTRNKKINNNFIRIKKKKN